jgi:hypothetical protein
VASGGSAAPRFDQCEEASRLGALDDSVVVGRSERHHLFGADLLSNVGQPDRIGDRARRDDRSLPGHQPRHGGDGPEPARVGQRDVGADEVVRAKGVGSRLVDKRVVGGEEGIERLASSVPQHRHHQRV